MIRSLPKPPKVKQDQQRLDFVRKMSCLIYSHGKALESGFGLLGFHLDQCTIPSEAHHVRNGAHAGTGRKPPASRTVPLCTAAHKEYHQIGHDSFCAKYGLDLEAHLLRINADFLRTHKPKIQRARKKAPGLRSITVQCSACQQVEKIPAGKVSKFGAALRYRCVRTNTVCSVRLAG